VLRSDGVAVVEIRGSVPEGISEVPVPVEPVPESIEVRLGGEPIPAIYFNGSLLLPSERSTDLYVRYVADTRVEGKSVVFLVREDYEVTLLVEPGVVLTSLPEKILETRLEDGKLVLTLVGPAKISYTLLSETTPAAPPEQMPLKLDYLALAAVLAVATAGVLLLLRRRRREFERESGAEIDETDVAILEKLEGLGGSALQSELREELGISKTTLWRRLRKLEELGYVTLSREGRAHRVYLRRRP